jgi:carbonic anhydrase/acetyltransferase-like protein (isoleucine patch superfamily)
MKFNKQIFTILILTLLVPPAVNASTHTDVVKEKNTNLVLFSNIMPNAMTPWNSKPNSPVIDHTAFVHPMASVIGAVTIGANVMVSPMASVRGDEGMPIFIGKDSNIQDGVVIHGLETIDEQGKPVENNLVVGSDGKKYTVYVGERVSLAHQSQVHGPTLIGNDTFIDMQAFLFKAHVGNNCVLEPKSAAIGVTIPYGRYISAGMVITKQKDADNLPAIFEGYTYQKTNAAVVDVNDNLAKGYNAVMAA